MQNIWDGNPVSKYPSNTVLIFIIIIIIIITHTASLSLRAFCTCTPLSLSLSLFLVSVHRRIGDGGGRRLRALASESASASGLWGGEWRWEWELGRAGAGARVTTAGGGMTGRGEREVRCSGRSALPKVGDGDGMPHLRPIGRSSFVRFVGLIAMRGRGGGKGKSAAEDVVINDVLSLVCAPVRARAGRRTPIGGRRSERASK